MYDNYLITTEKNTTHFDFYQQYLQKKNVPIMVGVNLLQHYFLITICRKLMDHVRRLIIICRKLMDHIRCDKMGTCLDLSN